MKELKGSVSIFFIFAIVLIISVVLSVTELARYNCQKLYLQMASDAGLDSMLSLFHRKLYDYYSIYGVEYRNDELLTEEYLRYIKPYFVDLETGRKINNWYNASINTENINLQYKRLIDDTYFEKEILEYMRYKIIGSTIEMFGSIIDINDENDLDKLSDNTREVFNKVNKTDIYNKLHKKYFNFKNDIESLEECIKNANESIIDVNDDIDEIKNISVNSISARVKNVKNKFNTILSGIERIYEKFIDIENQKEDFEHTINRNKDIYISDKNSGIYEFNDDICSFIESEFDEFLDKVKDGCDIDIAISEKREELDSLKNIISNISDNIDVFVREIDSIDDEIRRARNARDEEYDSEYFRDLNDAKEDIEREFKDYAREIKQDFRDIEIDLLSIVTSSGDYNDKKEALTNLSEIGENTILKLVLGNDKYDSIDNQSQHLNEYSILSENQYVSLNKILLTEYELDKFNYYNKGLNDEHTKSNSVKYEVERLIAGKNSDRDNLSGVANEIFKIRLAMNVLYIYQRQEMRTLARNFAYAIFSEFSPLLAEIMFLLIITAWGAAQSLIDVKRIIKNVKVSFIHNENTWNVQVTELLSIAQNGINEVDENDDEGMSFSYKDYLRMLLIITKQTEINERMISIIESNIKKEEDTFDIEKFISCFTANNTFTCKHFFTNLLLVNDSNVMINDEYKIKTSGYRSFIE